MQNWERAQLGGRPQFEPAVGLNPGIRVKFLIANPWPGQSRDPNVETSVLGMDLVINVGGLRLTGWFAEVLPRVGESIYNVFHQEYKFVVELNHDIVRLIEAIRHRDLTLSFTLNFTCLSSNKPATPQTLAVSHESEISEARWSDLLDQLGFKSEWVVTFVRPDVEGWEVVSRLLEKARASLDGLRPQEAVADCRAAWDAAEPLLEAKWDEIARGIDFGSMGEKDFAAKSLRARRVWEGVRNYSNTGPHQESYNANMDDAWFTYRLTVSTLAFLSRRAILGKIP